MFDGGHFVTRETHLVHLTLLLGKSFSLTIVEIIEVFSTIFFNLTYKKNIIEYPRRICSPGLDIYNHTLQLYTTYLFKHGTYIRWVPQNTLPTCERILQGNANKQRNYQFQSTRAHLFLTI